MLHGVAQHELYHAGQIAILKKTPFVRKGYRRKPRYTFAAIVDTIGVGGKTGPSESLPVATSSMSR